MHGTWCGTSFMIFAAGKMRSLLYFRLATVLQTDAPGAASSWSSPGFSATARLMLRILALRTGDASHASASPSNLLKVAMVQLTLEQNACRSNSCTFPPIIPTLWFSRHQWFPKKSFVSIYFQYIFFPCVFWKNMPGSQLSSKGCWHVHASLVPRKKLRMISKTRILVPFFLAKKFSHQKKNRKFFRETEVS